MKYIYALILILFSLTAFSQGAGIREVVGVPTFIPQPGAFHSQMAVDMLTNIFYEYRDSIWVELNHVRVIDNVSELQVKKYALGETIVNRQTGANYLIQADSVAGYDNDNVAVTPVNGPNYAVLQPIAGFIHSDWFTTDADALAYAILKVSHFISDTFNVIQNKLLIGTTTEQAGTYSLQVEGNAYFDDQVTINATPGQLGDSVLVSGTGNVIAATSFPDLATTIGPSVDHGVLVGLGDDDHSQYAFLAGRATGQTLIGGTGVTDDLNLQSTTGVGVPGADINFLVGNNGSDTAVIVANDGEVRIGSTTDQGDFDLQVNEQAFINGSPIVYTVDSLENILNGNYRLGDYIENRELGSRYQVQADSVAGYSIDTIAVIAVGSNFAVLQSVNGQYDVKWFGAVPDDDGTGMGTNNTLAFQASIDYVYSLGGGSVLISPSDSFYLISGIYLPSNICIIGTASGEDQFTGDNRGSKISISGNGLMIGYEKYSVTKRSTNVKISNLTLVGMTGAKSGIRIGSDSSFITPGRFTIQNVFIQGFDDGTVIQTIYDNSIPEFGSLDGNYAGTRPVTGAAGIFIAGGITGLFERVDIKECFYSVYESAGTLCTTLDFANCTFRLSDSSSVVFTTGKGINFGQNTVFEGSAYEALLLVSEISGISELQGGPSFILIDGCWFEGNSTASTAGFTIRAENFNSEGRIERLIINNNNLLAGIPSANLIHINRGRAVYIERNNFNLNSADTSLWTENSESVIFDGELKPSITVLDNQTVMKRRFKNGISDFTGGLNSDYRSRATGANTTEVSILGAGSTIGLNANTAFNKGDTFIFRFWGSFANNGNTKTIRLKLDASTIISNTATTAPISGFYIELMLVCNVFPDNYRLISRMLIDNTWETVITDIQTVSGFWTTNRIIELTGQNGTSSANDIVGEGYNIIYTSFK